MTTDLELSNFRRLMRSGIPLREFGPAGAFDSALPKARDDEPGEGRSAIDVLLALKERISPEGLKSLCLALCKGEGAEDDDPASKFESPMESEAAQDEPGPFPGRPRPGGKMDPLKPAQDGKLSGHESDYFANLVGKPRSSAAERRFAEMYPGAAAVRIR